MVKLQNSSLKLCQLPCWGAYLKFAYVIPCQVQQRQTFDQKCTRTNVLPLTKSVKQKKQNKDDTFYTARMCAYQYNTKLPLICNKNHCSLAIRFVLFINKLSLHLQVAAAFVIQATFLQEVNLPRMKSQMKHVTPGVH